MPETTTWPHQDLMTQNAIAANDLPEKTQRKLAKFAKETDTDTLESLDQVLFGEIDDFADAKKAAAKAEEKAAKHAEAKAKKAAPAEGKTPDIGDAPTAKVPPATPPAPARRSVMKTILGIK